MSGSSTKSAALAAIAIILGFGMLFYIMPIVTLWLANNFSVWLAVAFDVVAVLAFFLVFWLRARHQRLHR